MIKEFVRDSYTLFVRNPGYWDKTKPAYDTVRVQMFPDPIPRATALMAGDVDLGYAAGQGSLNEIGDKADANNLRIEAANGATMVLFNFQKGIAKDIRVREIMTMAFDPARTRDAIRPGNWDSLKLECPPFNPGDFECVEGVWPQSDPAKAKSLLATYKASGGSVDVKLLATSSNQADQEYIQQTLNDIGFNVTLDQVQPADWLPRVNSGDFEISWYAFGYPAANRLVTNLSTTGRNLPKHSLLNYDAAVTKARTSIKVEDQQAGWKETETIIAQNFLVGYFAPYLDGYIVSKDIDLGDQQRGIRLAYSEVFPIK
jgi:ABC-type transport system substrate-binding protein